MQKKLILVAGGSGTRMGRTTPKQFLLLANKPVLLHTLEAFYSYDPLIETIVVLPKQEIEHWKDLCKRYDCSIPHQTTFGGATRFQSVKNGLKLLHDGVVAVHDGVRPFPSPALIDMCYQTAYTQGSALPTIATSDSIRHISASQNIAVDRREYRLVQTPQTFHYSLLYEAYQQQEQAHFTDDASVVQSTGHNITLVEGERNNIKLTSPEDLSYAAFVLHS